MATTVESPGIASAKEEAAAILFARQPQTPSVMSTAAKEEPATIVQQQAKYPTFATYHDPEPMPIRPRAVKIETLRPYQTYDEVTVAAEPQVIHPYIDSSDYLSSAVAATTVAAETPEVTAVETPVTTAAPVKVVQSVLDTELEEDTQYVVKFKNSTIVAATIIATIFLLMAVLCVVNIVSLVTASAEVNALWQESSALHETLSQEQANLEQARNQATSNAGSANRNVQYVEKAQSTYTAPSSTTTNSSFFDWLCRSLSRLFS